MRAVDRKPARIDAQYLRDPRQHRRGMAAMASTCNPAQSRGGQRECFIAAYLLVIGNEPVQSAGGGDSM